MQNQIDTPLRVDGVAVSIHKKKLIDNVSFKVAKGSVTGLVGENGAGKSTLIKAILDFSHLSAGTIQIGEHPHDQKKSRQYLAYLPEHFRPPHYLNGREYLKYSAKLYGVPYPTKQKILQQLDLPERALSQPVKALSKGMVQKLGLLAMLHSQRPLLLLDEPMSGLDPRARFLLRQALETLAKENGTTILFTTHMLNDIQEMADTMLLMHHGALHYCGSPKDLLHQTQSNNLEEAFLRKTA